MSLLVTFTDKIRLQELNREHERRGRRPQLSAQFEVNAEKILDVTEMNGQATIVVDGGEAGRRMYCVTESRQDVKARIEEAEIDRAAKIAQRTRAPV